MIQIVDHLINQERNVVFGGVIYSEGRTEDGQLFQIIIIDGAY